MEVIDISKWEVLVDRNTTGSRTKYWVKNPSEEVFLFKLPKIEGELYAEIVAAMLADRLYGLKVPETHIALKQDEIGVLTKSFVDRKNGERFEEVIDYYDPDFDKDDLLQYTLDKSLEISSKYGMIDSFYEMCVFDSIIGNQDRHCENWGILYDSDNNASFAPLYDNGSSLLNGLSEDKVEEMLKKTSMIDGYINRAKTCFSINGKKRAKVSALYPVLKACDPVLLKSTIRKFHIPDYEMIDNVLADFDNSLMSKNRIKLLRIMIEKRTKLFFEYAFKEDE